MPKLSPEFKKAISSLSSKEMEKIIYRFSKSNQYMYDSLVYEYVDEQNTLELFEDVKEEIEFTFSDLSGRIIQKELAKSIGKSIQTINRFVKITKEKKLEADLLVFLLKIVFDNYSNCFGTCWTVFDSKVAITTNRLYNLVKNKLHYDYQIEYREDLNKYLKAVKKCCNHLDFVFNMAGTFE